MTHPIELTTAAAFEQLRGASLKQPVKSGEKLGHGLYFSWDTEDGDVSVTLDSSPGSLFSARIEIAKSPAWFTLNIALGETGLQDSDVLGLVAEISGDQPASLPVFIRSAFPGGGHGDTWLMDQLAVGASPAIRTLLHTAAPGSPLTGDAVYHTLIMNLPKESGTLTLRDMGVFVLPNSELTAGTPVTLAGYAS
ncbi:hypothetical protein KUV62_22010 [Salipiger bermudensis]|uniref:hypothetical protein n=1 Tax=Salipiger bermudensis TaxID=344736 RepID=UPI001C992686|nr:hypothetical protein [Salipiger bermudensis]MBY6006615.1 hypothetical protein [Salipiger bermudensis]